MKQLSFNWDERNEIWKELIDESEEVAEEHTTASLAKEYDAYCVIRGPWE